jgi:hypothetical protein
MSVLNDYKLMEKSKTMKFIDIILQDHFLALVIKCKDLIFKNIKNYYFSKYT